MSPHSPLRTPPLSLQVEALKAHQAVLKAWMAREEAHKDQADADKQRRATVLESLRSQSAPNMKARAAFNHR